MWWALRLYFAGFDDLMPVVGGAVWVFHNVIPVVKLLTVTVPTKLNLPPKKRTIKIAIHKVLGNISLHIQHFKWRKGTVFFKKRAVFFFKLLQFIPGLFLECPSSCLCGKYGIQIHGPTVWDFLGWFQIQLGGSTLGPEYSGGFWSYLLTP